MNGQPPGLEPHIDRIYRAALEPEQWPLFLAGLGEELRLASVHLVFRHPHDGDRGIIASKLRSDGRFEDLLYVDGGPGSTKTVGHLRMNGREVFRHAIQKISGIIEETLLAAGYAADEIDLFVPHQANKRILDGIAKKLDVPADRIIITLDKHGNTSAASIPLALNHAFEQHRLSEGKLVLLEAMGGGFTWGALLVRW